MAENLPHRPLPLPRRLIEGRYPVQTRYAVERADTVPMRGADDKLPTAAKTDVTGGISELLARVGEARAETDRRLGDLPADATARATQWILCDVDVRFRLHRGYPRRAPWPTARS